MSCNKNLVYHDELLKMANSAENKGTIREYALLAGAALLMGKYKEETDGNIHDFNCSSNTVFNQIMA